MPHGTKSIRLAETNISSERYASNPMECARPMPVVLLDLPKFPALATSKQRKLVCPLFFVISIFITNQPGKIERLINWLNGQSELVDSADCRQNRQIGSSLTYIAVTTPVKNLERWLSGRKRRFANSVTQ